MVDNQISRSLLLQDAVLEVHGNIISDGYRVGSGRRREFLELLESALESHSLRLVEPELLEIQIPHFRAALAVELEKKETREKDNYGREEKR